MESGWFFPGPLGASSAFSPRGLRARLPLTPCLQRPHQRPLAEEVPGVPMPPPAEAPGQEADDPVSRTDRAGQKQQQVRHGQILFSGRERHDGQGQAPAEDCDDHRADDEVGPGGGTPLGAAGFQGEAGRAHGDAEERRPSWSLAQDGPLLETSQSASATCRQAQGPAQAAHHGRGPPGAAAAAPGRGEDAQGGQEAEPHRVAAAGHGVEDGGRLQGQLGTQLEDLLHEDQGRAAQAEAVGGRQVEDVGGVGVPADGSREAST